MHPQAGRKVRDAQPGTCVWAESKKASNELMPTFIWRGFAKAGASVLQPHETRRKTNPGAHQARNLIEDHSPVIWEPYQAQNGDETVLTQPIDSIPIGPPMKLQSQGTVLESHPQTSGHSLI